MQLHCRVGKMFVEMDNSLKIIKLKGFNLSKLFPTTFFMENSYFLVRFIHFLMKNAWEIFIDEHFFGI